ncbi:MAG: hypothetical protein KDA89_24580, partial [Planctomycetaceae bacterium]|nr:hypothetical protein [Planctomycetaceae bacterium]
FDAPAISGLLVTVHIIKYVLDLSLSLFTDSKRSIFLPDDSFYTVHQPKDSRRRDAITTGPTLDSEKFSEDDWGRNGGVFHHQSVSLIDYCGRVCQLDCAKKLVPILPDDASRFEVI